MSASREKKQRQGGSAEQEVLASKQASAYKKKVRTYTVIGIIVAVLVAVLLIWNSGIFQRNQTAATVGDTKYSVNDVNYFYQQTRYNSFMYYYYFGSTVPDDDDIMDTESGQTYREYFLEQSLASLKEQTALYDEALANGWSDKDVADEVQEQIDSVKASAKSAGYSYGAYLKAQYGSYMTKSAFKSIMTKVLLANAYYADCYNAIEITADEISAYYEENRDSLDTYTYSALYFAAETVATTDADGNAIDEDEVTRLKEEALAAAKENAEAALAEVESGLAIDKIVEHFELSDSSATVEKTALGSSVSSAYSEELFTMAAGDAAVVEYGTSGYYVVTLHERKLVEDNTADVRHILFSAETTTDEDGNTVAPTEEAWAAAKAEAEEVLSQFKSGEMTAEAFGALANEYSDDSGSNTNGGLYEGVYQGRFVSELDSWLFDGTRTAGDVELIQHVAGEDDSNAYYGYHIVYYVGDANPVWMNTSESALREEKQSAWLEALSENYSADLASGSKHVAE